MNINEDTTHKMAFVHELKQHALCSNPFPIVCFHNYAEREINKAEQRGSRNVNL